MKRFPLLVMRCLYIVEDFNSVLCICKVLATVYVWCLATHEFQSMHRRTLSPPRSCPVVEIRDSTATFNKESLGWKETKRSIEPIPLSVK